MRPLLLPLLIAPALAGTAASAPPAPGQIIDRVVIDVYDVFETDDPADDTTLYTIANTIHFRTREAIIRRELLFKEGQPFDQALIEETERNIRALPFIRRAEVEGYVNSSGTLSVMVRAYDSWTLEPVAHVKRAGGVNELRFGLAEGNVLGYGKRFSAEYGKYGRHDRKSFEWSDPQVLGRRLRYDLTAQENSEARLYATKIERPFFASIAKVSWGAGARYAEEPLDNYIGDNLVGEDRLVASEATAFFGYAFKNEPRESKRLILGVERVRNEYRRRLDQEYTFFRVSGELRQFEYVKRRRVRKLSRQEDFNTGWELEPGAAWAPPMPGTTEERLQPRLTLRKGWRLPGHGLLLARHGYQSTYVNGGNGSRIADADVEAFLMPHPRHTIALHVGYAHGWRLDPAETLALGEDTGLRGYGLAQFRGRQRLILNAEDRIFFFENVLKLVDMGGVLFFDAGHAWPRRAPVRLGDLRKSVGIGLRLAGSRSSANDPIRLDLARALDSNRQRSRWSLSLLAGHAF